MTVTTMWILMIERAVSLQVIHSFCDCSDSRLPSQDYLVKTRRRTTF